MPIRTLSTPSRVLSLRGRVGNLTAKSVLLASLALASAAHAAVITQYSFPGAALTATTVSGNAAATAIDFAGSSASRFTLADVLAVNSGAGASGVASAVAVNSYFQFTVTPDAGFALDLDSFSLDAAYGSSGSGFSVRSSVDAYASDLLSAVVATAYPTLTNYTALLTTADLQNVTSAVTFRVYNYLGGQAGNPSQAFDNVTLNGTVQASAAVPVPGTAWLVLAGAAALLGTRRRC
ncbi:MAG: PEP-CTERM sorting domain-containing protein [Rubrivivax sp.]|nr:PEP-CTERM sorting domain-containing protein [Rubrivivax sp.]